MTVQWRKWDLEVLGKNPTGQWNKQGVTEQLATFSGSESLVAFPPRPRMPASLGLWGRFQHRELLSSLNWKRCLVLVHFRKSLA